MRKRLGLAIFGLFFSGVCAAHADPLESVAKQLAKGVSNLKEGRVAVLLFPYQNGDVSTGSSLVSERLTTLLAQRRHIQIIERSRLASVLGEIRLEGSGVTESSGSATAGGILGVDAIVTGTLSDHMDGQTEVNARLIRLETGEILAAASARIDRTWDDRPQRPETPGEDDDDDTSQYVMHESPLIFTPQASRGGFVAPAPEAVYAAAPEPTPAAGYAQVSAAAPTMVYGGTPMYSRRDHDSKHPHSEAQAQMLYAMGLTLDTQGHHQQAAHYYQRLLQETPASAPLRERAQDRIAGGSSHSRSGN